MPPKSVRREITSASDSEVEIPPPPEVTPPPPLEEESLYSIPPLHVDKSVTL